MKEEQQPHDGERLIARVSRYAQQQTRLFSSNQDRRKHLQAKGKAMSNFCAQCGTKLPEAARFCPNCGATTQSAAPPSSTVSEAARPAPPAEKSAANTEVVVANVRSAATLYRVPFPGATVRTALAAGSQVAPVERTDSGRWFNVLYAGSTNQAILGWIQAGDLNGMSLGERAVNPLDIPITNFDYNTRDDIVDLLGMIRRASNVGFGPLLFGILLLFVGFTAGVFFLMAPSEERALFFAIAGLGVGTVLATWGYRKQKRALDAARMNLGWAGDVRSWLKRLDRIRRGKQDLTENQMEHEVQMKIMDTAGHVLTKVTPEFKDLVALTKKQ